MTERRIGIKSSGQHTQRYDRKRGNAKENRKGDSDSGRASDEKAEESPPNDGTHQARVLGTVLNRAGPFQASKRAWGIIGDVLSRLETRG